MNVTQNSYCLTPEGHPIARGTLDLHQRDSSVAPHLFCVANLGHDACCLWLRPLRVLAGRAGGPRRDVSTASRAAVSMSGFDQEGFHPGPRTCAEAP